MIDTREDDVLDPQPPLTVEGLEQYAEGTASQVRVCACMCVCVPVYVYSFWRAQVTPPFTWIKFTAIRPPA